MEYSLKKPLFGKEVEFVLWYVDEVIALPAITSAYQEGLRLSKIFNFYDEKSELSLLNDRRELIASPELREVLSLALRFCALTKGKYDLSLGRLFLQRKQGKEEKPLACSYKDIHLNGNQVTLVHPDVLIDLGSVAKGYIVDKIVEHLQAQGVLSGLVNGRGDIRVFGDHEEVLGIRHPRKTNEIIATMHLKDAAVATSGDYYQYNKLFKKNHIINSSDVISVTVTAPTLALADVCATALFVSGIKERKKIMAQHTTMRAAVIDSALKIHTYNGFDEAHSCSMVEVST
jgi:thiamine biosynthesis lipoprotein